MNALENWYCSTSLWRWMTRERLLPWLLGRADLGNRLLEIGAGAGAATPELRKRVPQVISLEYDRALIAKLAQHSGTGAGVVRGDASALPFADCTFSSAVAVLVLHHLPSSDAQRRAFAEIHRVLQPGGRFFAFDIPDGWFNRLIHTRSTFTPLQSDTLAAQLAAAGFTEVILDHRPGGFRFIASRAN